jgi:hypothetical protein
MCRSRKLGLTLTSMPSFAPRRSATRRFLNASFLYAIFDLLFFLRLQPKVSSSDDDSEMLSKWRFVLVGNVLVDGDGTMGAWVDAVPAGVVDDTVGS